MRILAIDPGTSCGWAIGNSNAIHGSGTWYLQPSRGESPGMRYIRPRGNLEQIHKAYPDISLLAYEMPHHRGGASTQVGCGLVATIQTWCAEKKIEHTQVHSATIKKYATGSGRAKKDLMVRLGVKRFGKEDADDNEIDALWILEFVRERFAA